MLPPVSPAPVSAPHLHPVDNSPASDSPAPGSPAPDVVPPEKASLETLLLRSGLVSLRQLTEAQKLVQESGTALGEVLVDKGWVAAAALAELTAAEEEPAGEARTVPPLFLVFANLDTGDRLEVSEHEDEASARVAAAGAVELIESNESAVLELGERKFPASAVASIEIVELG